MTTRSTSSKPLASNLLTSLRTFSLPSVVFVRAAPGFSVLARGVLPLLRPRSPILGVHLLSLRRRPSFFSAGLIRRNISRYPVTMRLRVVAGLRPLPSRVPHESLLFGLLLMFGQPIYINIYLPGIYTIYTCHSFTPE